MSYRGVVVLSPLLRFSEAQQRFVYIQFLSINHGGGALQ